MKNASKEKRKIKQIQKANAGRTSKAAFAKKKKRVEDAIARELLNHSEGWQPGPIVKRTPQSKTIPLEVIEAHKEEQLKRRALAVKK